MKRKHPRKKNENLNISGFSVHVSSEMGGGVISNYWGWTGFINIWMEQFTKSVSTLI